MKIKHFFFILILFQGVLTVAQEPMVAYRKEGIWHYFDTNGKLMWQPFLDVASFPNGWHQGQLKAAAMNVKGDNASNIGFERKQVLYDKKGKIAYQPKYDSLYRITTGFDKAGYIQLRDLEAEKLILCDKQGNVVYKSEHGYCQYLGDGVVAYIKDGDHTDGDEIYVLYDIKTKKSLAEVNCVAFIGNYEKGAVFSFNSKSRVGMYNRAGRELLPCVWDSNLLNEDEEMVLSTGFVALQDTATKKFHLFNKNGEKVLSDLEEVSVLKNEYAICQKTIDGDMKEQQFFINNGKLIKADEPENGKIAGSTEGGILVLLKDDGDVVLKDKTLKNIATIKNVQDFENIKVLNTHIWILTSPNSYDCYNEKGIKTGTIKAEMVDKPAYNHVPFMVNSKWGLAHENGKIIVKPELNLDSEEIPTVENGYWGINHKLPDGSHRFDFYNFQGKLALSTTAEKDGWDYILSQETVTYFFKIY